VSAHPLPAALEHDRTPPTTPPTTPSHPDKELDMNPLLTLHLALLTLTDRTRTALSTRRQQMLQDRQAGLSTLEITIIALGLFLLAGIAVAVLTNATQGRLDQIQ